MMMIIVKFKLVIVIYFYKKIKKLVKKEYGKKNKRTVPVVAS